MSESRKDLAIEIARIIENKKGENIKILDVSPFASFADYFIIANGTSIRHTTALADEVNKKMSERGIILNHKEGYNNGRWILLDYQDIVVHIFIEEERDFYDLERIWKGSKYLEI